MTLTSSSTFADARAQWNDNLLWEGSPAKAANALEAIRWLLVNRAEASTADGRSTNFASLESEKKKLEDYVGITNTTAKSRRASFVKCRMRT